MKFRSRKSYELHREELLEPVRVRAHNVRKYGITQADYDRMLVSQAGACAICGSARACPTKESSFHIDHDHVTGEVRGLLCTRCNPGLGYFRDNEELLLAAIAYLRKYRKEAA